MINTKTLGVVQLIGALVAGYFGWMNTNWGVLVLAIVILVMGIHHLTSKKS